MAKEFLSMLGIDYEPLKTFSDDIEEWYDVTQTLRNIITTEFLMIPGYANMNDDERSAKISEYYENMKNGSYAPEPYFERLVLAYVEDKPRRSEYVDFVKKFMKRWGSSWRNIYAMFNKDRFLVASLEPNRHIGDDIIVGNIYVVATDDLGVPISMTDFQVSKYALRFLYPEEFDDIDVAEDNINTICSRFLQNEDW